MYQEAPYQPRRAARSEAASIRLHRYHVLAWGQPSAARPPLVLVHGYLGGSAQWSAEIAQWQDGFDVIAVDLAGYGQANALPAPTAMADHARAVLATLDHLGVGRFHLLGHSMGGMVVQDLVHQAPQRVDRLVLYGTGPLGSIPGRFETMARSRERLAAESAP